MARQEALARGATDYLAVMPSQAYFRFSAAEFRITVTLHLGTTSRDVPGGVHCGCIRRDVLDAHHAVVLSCPSGVGASNTARHDLWLLQWQALLRSVGQVVRWGRDFTPPRGVFADPPTQPDLTVACADLGHILLDAVLCCPVSPGCAIIPAAGHCVAQAAALKIAKYNRPTDWGQFGEVRLIPLAASTHGLIGKHAWGMFGMLMKRARLEDDETFLRAHHLPASRWAHHWQRRISTSLRLHVAHVTVQRLAALRRRAQGRPLDVTEFLRAASRAAIPADHGPW